jgi:hypothetical protein
MGRCLSCWGELKIIGAILEQSVIEKIPTHLGLQTRAPPRAPARGQALQAARLSLKLRVQAAPCPGSDGDGWAGGSWGRVGAQ